MAHSGTANSLFSSPPGHELEAFLNINYGPGNVTYANLGTLTCQGVKERWVGNFELDGAKYRRSKILLPSADNRFFSITTVYMQSEDEYSGQFHSHPYGEINCVVQVDPSAELKGMQGCQGAGWTSPGQGTHHYPQVRKGALAALCFLPAGRISYRAEPGGAQPHCV